MFQPWKRGMPPCALNHSPRGMTLVEVLAVVVILGLVAGSLLVGFSGTFGQARHELAKSGIGVVASKLELFRIATNTWPDNQIGLDVLSDGYAAPVESYYLGKDKLVDPWGAPYVYITPGPDGHPFEIMSYGADGQMGGTGENSDVSSINLRAGG